MYLNMWAWVLLLGALAAGAHADCDACVAGRCHTRRTLLQGFHVSNQLAIDRTSNVLYAQLQSDTITALYLDKPKLSTFKVANSTRGLAVDQETETVYTSHDRVIYKHKYKKSLNGYTTEVAFTLGEHTATPARLRYEDTLYIVHADGSSAYFSKNQGTFAGYDNLEDFDVTDLVNVVNITNWFFVSNNKLYKFILDNGKRSHLIFRKKHVLSIGKLGDVYAGDVHNKVIYKLDRTTGSLVKYITYKHSSVEDFVFDKEENVVFLDAEGNVAQWVPDDVGRCFFEI